MKRCTRKEELLKLPGLVFEIGILCYYLTVIFFKVSCISFSENLVVFFTFLLLSASLLNIAGWTKLYGVILPSFSTFERIQWRWYGTLLGSIFQASTTLLLNVFLVKFFLFPRCQCLTCITSALILLYSNNSILILSSLSVELRSKNGSTEGCSKLKSPETRQIQEILSQH